MKIQYYALDLSIALDLGEIHDMFVETDAEGNQILKIDCEKKKEDAYQTIRVTKKTVQIKPKPTKRTKRYSDTDSAPRNRLDTEKPGKMTDTIMNIGKRFLSNKEKPGFMKDAGF